MSSPEIKVLHEFSTDSNLLNFRLLKVFKNLTQ